MDKVEFASEYVRPQILFIGNGLEYSVQPEWKELLKKMEYNDHIELSEEDMDSIPFPLLFEIITSHNPAPAHLSLEDIKEQRNKLSTGMKGLEDKQLETMKMIPDLGVEHVFTTNYSYCLEKSFLPDEDFLLEKTRKKYRFNVNPEKSESNKQKLEKDYRLHRGYVCEDNSGKQVGIWHIHGEKTAVNSIIIGHDKYGRQLSRIETICSGLKFKEKDEKRNYVSWPELFIAGDVYIVGFGYCIFH